MEMVRIRFHVQPYDYFPLCSPSEAAFSAGCGLVVRRDGQVTLVDWANWRYVGECQFAASEFPILLTLLDAWPSYCPYIRLLRLVSGEPELGMAQSLQAGVFQEALAPVCEKLKTYQERLSILGLCVGAVYRCGYILRSLPLPPLQQRTRLVSLKHHLIKKNGERNF